MNEQHKSEIVEGKVVDTKKFQRLMKPVIKDNIGYSLEKGFFKTAHKMVDKYIEKYPQDAEGYFLKGELFRQRQDKIKRGKLREKTKDFVTAAEFYQKAIESDSSYSQAYKGLARVLQKQGELQGAIENYEAYLMKAPSVDDRAYIEQTVASLKESLEI